MEVKINREIRDYTESIFFGLSLRQFVFALAAVLAAVCIFFLLKPRFGIDYEARLAEQRLTVLCEGEAGRAVEKADAVVFFEAAYVSGKTLLCGEKALGGHAEV